MVSYKISKIFIKQYKILFFGNWILTTTVFLLYMSSFFINVDRTKNMTYNFCDFIVEKYENVYWNIKNLLPV